MFIFIDLRSLFSKTHIIFAVQMIIENRYQKFENDYWSVSINELIKKTNLDKNNVIKVAICGAHPRVYSYLKKGGYKNLVRSDPKNADYIIMTNRTSRVSGEFTEESTNKTVKILNCFDRLQT